jgi:hypothetical protein
MWAPQIYVSRMQGARNQVVKTGSTVGVFLSDSHVATLDKAKHFFPGFTIRFRTEHSFVTSAGTSEIIALEDYQG